MRDASADAIDFVALHKLAAADYVLAVRNEAKGEGTEVPHSLLTLAEITILDDLRLGDELVLQAQQQMQLVRLIVSTRMVITDGRQLMHANSPKGEN